MNVVQSRFAHHALQLELFECIPGFEQELAEIIRRDNPKAHIYKCLGRYDILSLQEIDKLDIFRPALRYTEIRSRANFFAFGHQQNQSRIQLMHDTPAASLTLLKLNAGMRLFIEELLSEPSIIKCLAIIENTIRKCCDKAVTFSTLGNYQILVFQFGSDIGKILGNISEIRNIKLGHLNRDVPDAFKGVPLIEESVTIPLVGYDENCVLRFGDISGTIRPLVFLGCPPGYEGSLKKIWSEEGANIFEVYGRSDLVAFWESKDVNAAKFVELIVEHRRASRSRKNLLFTSSVLLSGIDTAKTQVNIGGLAATDCVAQAAIEKIKLAMDKLRASQSTDDAELTLIGNLQALLSLLYTLLTGPHALDFADMGAFSKAFAATICQFLDARQSTDKQQVLESMMDSILIGIEQRTTNVFPEAFSHTVTVAGTQTGFSVVLDAAGFIPEFLHNCCCEHLPPKFEEWKGNWAGYIMFTQTAGPSSRHGEVINLPLTWMYRPIRKWWTISHEFWHTLYNRQFAAQFPYLLRELEVRTEIGKAFLRTLVRELFAEWMDFYYCFQQDTNLFLKLVWDYWLKIASVRSNLQDYLLRSFLIFLSADNTFDEIQNKKVEGFVVEAKEMIDECWAKFMDLLGRNVPSSENVFAEISPELIDRTRSDALMLLGILSFFKQHLISDSLARAIQSSRTDPKAEIDQILRGVVPAHPIENPIPFVIELAGRDIDRDKPLPGATAALIHSFATGHRILRQKIEEQQLSDLAVFEAQ